MSEIISTPVMSITGNPTHHFFAVNKDTEDILRTYYAGKVGRIMVYTDREKCQRAAHKRWPDALVMVVGMGDVRWAMFQRSESYIVVE